jgi:hypothetical protein
MSGRALRALTSACLVVALPGCGARKGSVRSVVKEQTMNGSSPANSDFVASTIAIHYIHHVGWSGARMGGFSYREPSIARVTYSYDGRQEIGLWRATVDPKLIEEAQLALRSSRYQELSPSEGFPPETKFVDFEEEMVGEKERAMWGFPLHSIPPVIVPVIQKFDALVELVRAHPVRVLRGSAKWSQREFRTDEELVVELQLTAVGTAELEAGNPFVAGPRGPKGIVRLVLEGVAPRTEALQVDLEPANVIGQKPAMKDAIFPLAPGQSWSLRLGKRVHAVPGRYRGVLSYYSAHSFTKDGPETNGEIPIDLGEIAIVPPRR